MQQPTPKLVRTVGFWGLVAMCINAVVGSGVFLLPYESFLLLGPFSLWAPLLFAIPVFILVLDFAEAASHFDGPGGAYPYARSAFGDFIGFETGWMNWLARVTSLASLSNGFVLALALLVPSLKKDVATGELGTLASALPHAGSEVSEQGGMSGRAITTIADRIDSFGRSIEGQDLDQVMHRVERFARRNPAAFIGGAVALGFIASRFLKSSRSFDRDDFYSSEAYGGYRGDRIDSAIGSAAYGTGGYGTTYGSELDASRQTERTGFETLGDVEGSDLFGAPSTGTGITGGAIDRAIPR